MGAEKIQSEIDALLTYMNDDMENLGETIKTVSFGFHMDQNDCNAICYMRKNLYRQLYVRYRHSPPESLTSFQMSKFSETPHRSCKNTIIS